MLLQITKEITASYTGSNKKGFAFCRHWGLIFIATHGDTYANMPLFYNKELKQRKRDKKKGNWWWSWDKTLLSVLYSSHPCSPQIFEGNYFLYPHWWQHSKRYLPQQRYWIISSMENCNGMYVHQRYFQVVHALDCASLSPGFSCVWTQSTCFFLWWFVPGSFLACVLFCFVFLL